MTMDPVTAIASTAILLPVDNVDTDQIIPARFLKITDRRGLGEHAFADWRYDADGNRRSDFPLNAPGAPDAKVLVVGHNFGCGSSREHAAWALHALGIRAIVSTGFADIFRDNALSNGMLPIVLGSADHAAVVQELRRNQAAVLKIDLAGQSLGLAADDQLRTTFAIDPFAKHCLLHGIDHLGYLLDAGSEIAAYEASHPAPVCTTV